MEESKYPFQTSCRFSAAKKNTLSNTYGFFALKYYNYNCIGCSVRLRETFFDFFRWFCFGYMKNSYSCSQIVCCCFEIN